MSPHEHQDCGYAITSRCEKAGANFCSLAAAFTDRDDHPSAHSSSSATTGSRNELWKASDEVPGVWSANLTLGLLQGCSSSARNRQSPMDLPTSYSRTFWLVSWDSHLRIGALYHQWVEELGCVKPQRLRRARNLTSDRKGSHLGSTGRKMRCTSRAS
jgi:hypothetical protein